MKLTLRQEWRLRPLNSFLGCLDIKLGVTIALLFALLNKVAGVYGLIAVFTGASFAQLSMYVYSVATLVAFGWALKVIVEEDPQRSLYFAHFFFADHILSTAWTVFFGVVWWLYTPHDGRRQANSSAQEELMKSGAIYSSSGHNANMTDDERAQAAMMIWNKEKGTAVALIAAGWCVKIYFAILIYSFAIHLRKGSYRNLPYTSKVAATHGQYVALNGIARGSSRYAAALGDDGDEENEADDFYRMPQPSTAGALAYDTVGVGRVRTPGPGTGSSVGSFADFVSAPGRGRRGGRQTPTSAVPKSAGGSYAPKADFEDVVEEVLFDSDEPELGGGRSSRSSKFGGEGNTSVSSGDDREEGSSNLEGGRRPRAIAV